MKICTTCEIEKTLDNFRKNKINKDGLNYFCFECERNYKKLYYQKNKEKVKEYKKRKKVHIKNYQKGYRLRKYELTIEKYNEMLLGQNNCCKICLTPKFNNGKRLAVDHCHKTGKIRGLLCESCNRAIGLLKDDVVVLENAIKYIKSNLELNHG